MRKAFDLSLYLVLDPDLCGPMGMIETTRAAVAGGVTMVQLRDKRASTAALVEAGWALQDVLATRRSRLAPKGCMSARRIATREARGDGSALT
jgi:thiamine-phosphate pyrophosphorylase